MHISKESLKLLHIYILKIAMELIESSGVNGAHYGWFRAPVRVNQVPSVAKDLQQGQKAGME